MALHKDFPKDKFQILDPAIRWFPADEDLRKEGYESFCLLLFQNLEKKWLNGVKMIMTAQVKPQSLF